MLRSKGKNLSCFYCGRRSGVQFSGQPSFECKHCEAINWLDENGTITDPPAATAFSDEATHPAASFRLATRRNAAMELDGLVSSPTMPPTDVFGSTSSIFCAKCQRNQELLARTLKEYEFPDDTNDPEYAVRAKGYRAWKRDLETRYPQVCIQCEPKVEEQLQKASYTAKTDHMRRMIDRTKERRHRARKRTPLDYVDSAGKWSWHVSFMLQTIWHVVVLSTLFVQEDHHVIDNWAVAILRQASASALNVLPQSDRFIKWAVNTSLLAAAWNPRFKQTIRGFTAHILGFRQWYTYQLVIILIRCACLFLSQYNDAQGIPALTQLGAHLVIGWLMFYVYKVAGKAIRTDNTPLFGTRQSAPSAQRTSAPPDLHPRPNDLSGVLDEIMASSPKGVESHASTPQSVASPYQSMGLGGGPLRNGFIGTPSRQPRSGGFGGLNLSSSPHDSGMESQTTQYGEEMDWSPSGSQHRAFSTHEPYKVKNPNPRFTNSRLGFNDTPLEPKPGPFWYKVPPAPMNPAQRLRNPTQPVIRESPKERQENFFSNSRKTLDLGSSSQNAESSFTLKDPQFYAPGPRDDPRDGLSSMMGSFSISPDPEERRATSGNGMNGVLFATNRAPATLQNNSKVRMAELLVLFGALWAWVTALGTQESYGSTLGLGAICACLIVSVRLTADLLVDAQVREGRQPSIFSLSWANLGYAQVIGALVLVWKTWAGSAQGITGGVYGNALLGVMIAHQFWHVFS
ncbi:putative Ima1 N-terminal domain-containing protein [Seiridium unicorne]|uniref:Ima1 N-terminal domain-containing protein n=1 Tax=Seiridium unicorne TaxID=138068 RepID=A0ABR2UJD6_9PEZI